MAELQAAHPAGHLHPEQIQNLLAAAATKGQACVADFNALRHSRGSGHSDGERWHHWWHVSHKAAGWDAMR